MICKINSQKTMIICPGDHPGPLDNMTFDPGANSVADFVMVTDRGEQILLQVRNG
jgi:hypothetical protein